MLCLIASDLQSLHLSCFHNPTPLLLIEGAHTNIITQSNDYALWTSVVGGGQGTSNTAFSPDGLQNAGTWDLPVASVNKYGPNVNPGLTNGAKYTIQGWAKAATTGSVGFPFRVYGGSPTAAVATVIPTDTWKRFSGSGVVTTTSVIGATGVAGSPNVGDPAFSQWSAFMYGMQMCALPHRTSLVNTSGVAGTCGADNAVFSTAEYSNELCTAGGTFTIYPEWASSQIPNFDTRYILFMGGPSDRMMFESGSNRVYLRLVAGNVTKLQTNDLTFSADSPLTITFQPNAGKLRIDGASGGGGSYTFSPFTWPNLQLCYGAAIGGGFELYARVGNIYNVQT